MVFLGDGVRSCFSIPGLVGSTVDLTVSRCRWLVAFCTVDVFSCSTCLVL